MDLKFQVCFDFTPQTGQNQSISKGHMTDRIAEKWLEPWKERSIA